MAIVYKNCLHCSEKFPSKNLRAKFCGSACRSAHNRELQKPLDTPPSKLDARVQRPTPQSPTKKPAPVMPTLQELADLKYGPAYPRIPVVLTFTDGTTCHTNIDRDSLEFLIGFTYKTDEKIHTIMEVKLNDPTQSA